MPRHDTQSFSLVALTEVPAPEHTLFCTTVVLSPLPAHSPTRTAGTCEPAWSPSHRPPFLLRILWTSLRGLPEASWMILTFWGRLFPQPGTCFTFLCPCVWKVYLSFEDWFFCEVFLRSHSRNESFPFLAGYGAAGSPPSFLWACTSSSMTSHSFLHPFRAGGKQFPAQSRLSMEVCLEFNCTPIWPWINT